jgi:DNA-binding transcriptional ArsR family regulator
MSEALDRTLAALADPHRRRAVDLLRERPRRAGELAESLGLTPPAMSRHLRALRQSGLVEESHPEFDARVRVYRLRPEPMVQLKAWLEAAEDHWADQLSALKAHVEGKARGGGA